MRSLQIIEREENIVARTNSGMTAERALAVGNERMEKYLYAGDNVLKWVEVNGKYLNAENKGLLLDEINGMHGRLVRAIELGGVKRFAGFKTS